MSDPKIKALLVEDDRPAGEALAYMLGRLGIETEHVRRGEDVLEAATRMKPDVVLLDIRLAGEMDGYAVIAELKRHPFLAKVPVMIVTNYGLMQDVEKGKKSGAVEYLVKSDWSIREIAEKVIGHVRKAGAAD